MYQQFELAVTAFREALRLAPDDYALGAELCSYEELIAPSVAKTRAFAIQEKILGVHRC